VPAFLFNGYLKNIDYVTPNSFEDLFHVELQMLN